MPCANRARVVLRLSIYTGSRMARWLSTGTSFNRSRRRRPMATACSDQMAAHSQPDNLSVLAIADEVIEEAAICCCWQEDRASPMVSAIKSHLKEKPKWHIRCTTRL